MTTTTAQPAASHRLLPAAPVADPDAFARTITALSGRVPDLTNLRGLAGRNDNWLVPTTPDGELFVKRLRGEPQQVATRMARVAAFERLIVEAPPESFRTPAYYGADAVEGLLVFDCVTNPRTVSDVFADDELEVSTAQRLGHVVAEIHRLPRMIVDGVDEPRDSRPAAALYALDPETYANCSGGEVEAWAMLQHDKQVLQALTLMRAASEQAPVNAAHGDLRLDQFMISGGDVYVVDWEEFRYGDPACDIGAVVGEFIHHAAGRMFTELAVEEGLAPGAAHEAIVAQGQQQLEKVRDYVQVLWSAYREHGDLGQDPGLAVRATRYAGWHFFDRLLAGATRGAKLSAAERGMAGIGRNALTDPERYAAVIGFA